MLIVSKQKEESIIIQRVKLYVCVMEQSGSVVECLTQVQGAASLSLTGLCP